MQIACRVVLQRSQMQVLRVWTSPKIPAERYMVRAGNAAHLVLEILTWATASSTATPAGITSNVERIKRSRLLHRERERASSHRAAGTLNLSCQCRRRQS